MVAILKEWNQKQCLAASESKGKKGITSGSYIGDLVALGKCVWLCWKCEKKFNAKACGYGKKPGLPRVRGFCDGCRANGTHKLFAPNAHHDGWTGVKNV